MPTNFSPLRAIRKKCLECCGGGHQSVTWCKSEDCSLFPFRFGMTPAKAVRKHGDKAWIQLPEGHEDRRAGNRGALENLHRNESDGPEQPITG